MPGPIEVTVNQSPPIGTLRFSPGYRLVGYHRASLEKARWRDANRLGVCAPHLFWRPLQCLQALRMLLGVRVERGRYLAVRQHLRRALDHDGVGASVRVVQRQRYLRVLAQITNLLVGLAKDQER